MPARRDGFFLATAASMTSLIPNKWQQRFRCRHGRPGSSTRQSGGREAPRDRGRSVGHATLPVESGNLLGKPASMPKMPPADGAACWHGCGVRTCSATSHPRQSVLPSNRGQSARRASRRGPCCALPGSSATACCRTIPSPARMPTAAGRQRPPARASPLHAEPTLAVNHEPLTCDFKSASAAAYRTELAHGETSRTIVEPTACARSDRHARHQRARTMSQ